MGIHKNDFAKKFEFLFIRGLFLIVKLSPLAVNSWLGEKLGVLSFRLLKRRRDLTLENIREARERGFLPSDTDDYQLAQKTWQNMCLSGIEFAYYYSHSHETIRRTVAIEGAENLTRALEKKKGVVLITTHLGNWELMGMALSLAGFKINSIVQAQANDMWDQYINDCRRSIGMKLIRKRGFLRPIVDAFNRNEVVSFFIDQHAKGMGLLLKVFGRDARIPRGAAEFALKLDKPVVFAYIVRESPGKHRLVISEEIQLSTSGDYQKDLQENTVRFIGLVQSTISQYPEQWLWMHRLWKTKIRL
jgi:KDO2-lipid IV(A) lauroyltransferase